MMLEKFIHALGNEEYHMSNRQLGSRSIQDAIGTSRYDRSISIMGAHSRLQFFWGGGEIIQLTAYNEACLLYFDMRFYYYYLMTRCNIGICW